MEYTDRLTKGNLEAALPKIVTGTYTGNGVYPRAFSLGGRPKALLLTSYGIIKTSATTYGGLAVDDGSEYGSNRAIHLTNNGFELVNTTNYYTNGNNDSYEYLAIL